MLQSTKIVNGLYSNLNPRKLKIKLVTSKPRKFQPSNITNRTVSLWTRSIQCIYLSDEHESGVTELWLSDGVDHHLNEWNNSMRMESGHMSWDLQINTQPTKEDITSNFDIT